MAAAAAAIRGLTGGVCEILFRKFASIASGRFSTLSKKHAFMLFGLGQNPIGARNRFLANLPNSPNDTNYRPRTTDPEPPTPTPDPKNGIMIPPDPKIRIGPNSDSEGRFVSQRPPGQTRRRDQAGSLGSAGIRQPPPMLKSSMTHRCSTRELTSRMYMILRTNSISGISTLEISMESSMTHRCSLN